MAWRPHNELIRGVLDNTVQGRVFGLLRFAGIDEDVRLDLKGDFHRDIRGTIVRLIKKPQVGTEPRPKYMRGFATLQTGEVGDMTAGREPADYVRYPYFEWYSAENGRVVLELDADEVELLGTPLPPDSEKPIDRGRQQALLVQFLASIGESVFGKFSN